MLANFPYIVTNQLAYVHIRSRIIAVELLYCLEPHVLT